MQMLGLLLYAGFSLAIMVFIVYFMLLAIKALKIYIRNNEDK